MQKDSPEFQFHKGTIRTDVSRSFFVSLLYFNSIKVRLELDVPERNDLGELTFQFHKGTIRTSSGGGHLVASVPFQFHKGTIRTFQSGKRRTKIKPFQFHKGTIRTVQAVGISSPPFHFNSIKVRLELSAIKEEHVNNQYFNSIKVRLEQRKTQAR